MMVTFISQCEKKALNRTRRVLDAFANRIGERTWQTIITEDGLIAVKKLLRQTVTKNTAVACHWMRSRTRSELTWIVGQRQKFNRQGFVPVNTTLKNHRHGEWENDWTYLPAIKALVAMAALLHDWGKATLLFQEKLKNRGNNQRDPLRHEWLSCLLLNALVALSGDKIQDDAWLTLLMDGPIDEQKLISTVSDNLPKPLKDLPPLARLIAWLIVTHHRLPYLGGSKKLEYAEQEMASIEHMLQHIDATWGYKTQDEADYIRRIENCFRFEQGLLSNSNPWNKSIKKWASRLKEAQPQIQQLIDNGAWRVALHHARLCLMLGDHYYSSCDADAKWQSAVTGLYANTDKNRAPKQKLDEHLVNVCEQALKVGQSLARFTTDMAVANDIKKLKQKSEKSYAWQDTAVEKMNAFKLTNTAISAKNCGWFTVNMASTGCGKTLANAKIMGALSPSGDSLRYILALGLRTLTLQTGDEYREKIGFDKDELAVLIGSAAVQELHGKNKVAAQTISYEEELGSESLEQLLDEEVSCEDSPMADFLDAIIPKHAGERTKKNQAFLYKPVLVCTLDHIMAATETCRGGKYILPCLRLLSSDLVIDEVDDFEGKDLIAIGRLIHLAGMLGRKVMISSATIPPALAEGFFNAYQEGWGLYARFKSIPPQIACAWVDEFDTHIEWIDKIVSSTVCEQYQGAHKKFVDKRIKKLQQQIIRRKAYIVNCDDIYQDSKNDEQSRETHYFEKMKQSAIDLHQKHHFVDQETSKKVSFGVIRVANIPPCIKLSQYLMSHQWPENITPKIMAYHSRQILLLRSQQEKHLDEVLKRKKTVGHTINNPFIRAYLNNTTTENIVFILVATPVIEVGRDHDFDWTVVEPSSYRSIIQLAGRVRRHRDSGIKTPNMAIMQYNLKGLRKDNKPVYCRPGYETARYKLNNHDLSKLLDESTLNHSVDAIARISQAGILQSNTRLADLEHAVLIDHLTSYTKKGPQCLQAWLSECWWLTALPQQFNRFRESQPEIKLYAVWQDGNINFCERDPEGKFIPREGIYGIKKDSKVSLEDHLKHAWLVRNYESELSQRCVSQQPEQNEEQMQKDSKRYGELMLPAGKQKFLYSDQFGLLVE